MKMLKVYLIDKRNSKCLGICYIDISEKLKNKINQDDENIFNNFKQDCKIYKLPSISLPNRY